MARKSKKYKTTQRQEKSIAKTLLRSKGLGGFPYTGVSENTQNKGILGIGILKPRNSVLDFNPESVGPSSKPINTLDTVIKYTYFFIKRESPFVSGSADYQYFFYVIKAIKPISHSDCADQTGLNRSRIVPLSDTDYLTGSFSHPKYINDTYSYINIRYAEISTLPQKNPGRMDNIPFGYPDFNYNPSPVITSSGLLPAKPYPDFYLSGESKGATGVSAITGDSILFLDNSVKTPSQVRPSSWVWEFGIYSSPTGSTAQNPVVYYTSPGVYDVKLTAINDIGTTTINKTSYITIT